MPKPFKVSSTRPLPPDAEIVDHDGKPHARLKLKGRSTLFPLTKDGLKYLRPSKCYYFECRDALGTVRRVKGYADLKATEQLAAETERKASRIRSGHTDPSEQHALRPLVDHLKDYAAALEQKGDTTEHVKKTAALISTLLAGAGFVFPRDVDAAKASEWLNAIRRDRRPVELPAGTVSFVAAEVAKLLGITASAVGKNLKRRGLSGIGYGKARRIPRAAVETLAIAAVRGVGPQQCNHYVRATKGFLRWMTRTRRIGANPIDTLTLLNTAVDVRHGRRELTAGELRKLLMGTQASQKLFRGLTGEARYFLYLLAAGTGFRANALANLSPADFDLESDSPTVTLAARFNKSGKTKVQPLPTDVADALRSYLTDKSANALVWAGTWREKAAEMLRADLEAAGIAYSVDGSDGPEFADFHALRHSYLTLGGRSGIDLRTLQELAGHSTPLLTARYMHVRLRDVAGAVNKMPNLVPSMPMPIPVEIPLRMTGTDGVSGVVPGVVPGVVRGDIRPLRNAPLCTLGVFGGNTGEVKEPLEMTEAGAFLPRPASVSIPSSEWSLPGLNWGPSDFQSLARVANSPENQGILNIHRTGCTAGCTIEPSEGGIPDAELATLLAA